MKTNLVCMHPDVANEFRRQEVEVRVTEPCYCVGPQNGEPLCPCRMREAKSIDRGTMRIMAPEQEVDEITKSTRLEF